MREDYLTPFSEREPNMSSVAEELEELYDEVSASIPENNEWSQNNE